MADVRLRVGAGAGPGRHKCRPGESHDHRRIAKLWTAHQAGSLRIACAGLCAVNLTSRSNRNQFAGFEMFVSVLPKGHARITFIVVRVVDVARALEGMRAHAAGLVARAERCQPELAPHMRRILPVVACMIAAFDAKVVPHPSFQCMRT